MKNIIKAIAAAVLIVLSVGAAAVCTEEENTLIISYEAEGLFLKFTGQGILMKTAHLL